MVGRDKYAYRLVYEAKHGVTLPASVVLHHLCEEPGCVNPDHMEEQTPSSHRKHHGPPLIGAQIQRDKTHCPQGHPYDEANTAWVTRADRGGQRERHCRECMNEWKRRNRAIHGR